MRVTLLKRPSFFITGSILLLSFLIICFFIGKSKNSSSHFSIHNEWKKDHLYHYDLDYSNVGRNLSEEKGGKKSLITIKKALAHIKGSLDIVTLPTPSFIPQEDLFLQFKLTPGIVTFKQNEDLIDMPDKEILFYVQMTKKGIIKSFKMREDIYVRWGGVTKEFLSLIEFPLPSPKKVDAKKWISFEKNFAGDSQVSWELLNTFISFDRVQLIKKYLHDSGSFLFTLNNKKKEVQEINGNKVVKKKLSDADDFQNDIHFSLKLLSVEYLKTRPSFPSLSGFISDDLRGIYMASKIKKQMQGNILKGESQEVLRSSLMEGDMNDRNFRTSLFLKLRAMFLLNPKSVFFFRDILLTLEQGDQRFLVLVGALINSGLPEAQELFRDLVSEVSEEKKKQSLMTSLSFTGEGTLETEKFFRDMTHQSDNPLMRGTAHYSLGTVAHFLREGQPQRAKKILQEYEQLLSDVTDDPYHEKTIDYLNVIGNIGLLEQVKTIRPYLSSQDLDLRRVAYSALRYVNSEDAHRYLTEALIHEKEDSIREISAESLSETEGDQITFSTYEKVLFTEKNRAVLRFVLNNLGKMKDSYPKSLHLIDQFIGKCGGDEICRYAESLKISLGIKNG